MLLISLFYNIYFLLFSRYEWQHRGSTHIHGFLSLQIAPNMDTIDWENALEVANAHKFFDHYVIVWNPRQAEHRNIPLHQSTIHNPCLLDTQRYSRPISLKTIQSSSTAFNVKQSVMNLLVFVRKTMNLVADMEYYRS